MKCGICGEVDPVDYFTIGTTDGGNVPLLVCKDCYREREAEVEYELQRRWEASPAWQVLHRAREIAAREQSATGAIRSVTGSDRAAKFCVNGKQNNKFFKTTPPATVEVAAVDSQTIVAVVPAYRTELSSKDSKELFKLRIGPNEVEHVARSVVDRIAMHFASRK